MGRILYFSIFSSSNLHLYVFRPRRSSIPLRAPRLAVLLESMEFTFMFVWFNPSFKGKKGGCYYPFVVLYTSSLSEQIWGLGKIGGYSLFMICVPALLRVPCYFPFLSSCANQYLFRLYLSFCVWGIGFRYDVMGSFWASGFSCVPWIFCSLDGYELSVRCMGCVGMKKLRGSVGYIYGLDLMIENIRASLMIIIYTFGLVGVRSFPTLEWLHIRLWGATGENIHDGKQLAQ